jgi:peroxiredoxin
MSSRSVAHFSIAAFLAVFAVCLAIIVQGDFSPGVAGPIAIGERVPDFHLQNTAGEQIDTADFPADLLMLVYVPEARLTGPQQQAVHHLALTMQRSAQINVVAVTGRAEPGTRPGAVLPDACELLVDTTGTVRSTLGYDHDPLVCVIDQQNRLRYRTTIGEEGGQTAQVNREALHHLGLALRN